jgi:glc operon protein GlcG
MRAGLWRINVKKILVTSGTVLGLTLMLTVQLPAQQQARSAPATKATRDIKVISSAGARALADACSAWAEQNKQVVAMAILDWGGNLIESHAMEGAAMNAIDTALLKAKSALRWRRPTSETNKMVRSGQNLAPTFMRDFPQPGALPIVVNGEVIGAMGVSGADGEKCAQAAIDAVFKGQGASSGR